MTAKLVDRAAKRLDRSRKAAAESGNGAAHDTALHQVRKDAKRLRHAAESVTALHGKRARKPARAAHRLQKILGTHQDSVMARTLLSRLATAPDVPEGSTLTYARLQDIEEHISRGTEAKYLKAVKKKALKIRLRH